MGVPSSTDRLQISNEKPLDIPKDVDSLNLPKDVWSLILQYCDLVSITALSLVSKSWVQTCWNMVHKVNLFHPSSHDLQSFFNRNNQIYSMNIQNASLLNSSDFGSLVYLTALQSLRMKDAKDFSGEPLKSLQNLQKLALTHRCDLQVFDTWIYSLTNLTSLDFSYCTKLDDKLDFSQLPKLSSLKLSYSKYIDVSNLSLTRLHLDGVDLTKTSISRLTTLTNLKDLSLSLVKFNSIHNFVFAPLVKLNLCGLRILDETFEKFTTLSELEYLNISCCKLLNESLQIIPQYFLNLTYLNVSETRISDRELFSFKKLSQLINLHLGNTFLITDEGIQYLRFCTRITTLRLNKSKKIRNESLYHLSPLVYLSFLNLADCKSINDEGLSFLKLGNLTQLDLTYCNDITDEGLMYLKSMPIYNLKLSFCHKITATGLSNLNPNILHLSLAYTNLTNSSLEILGSHLTNLQTLDISYCSKVNHEGLVHLKGCLLLQTLILSGTKVTDDVILMILKNTKNIRKIGYMSCDHLSETVLERLREFSKKWTR